jgi:hypothetical protein
MVGERKQLPFLEWPPDIRRRWEAAFVKRDFLDEDGPGAHLAPGTRASLQSACGCSLPVRPVSFSSRVTPVTCPKALFKDKEPMATIT